MGTAPRIVYQQGDHVCTLFSEPKEQLQAAIEYIKGGLERNERCLYVCGETTPDELRAVLRDSGVDVAAAQKRGALVLITKHEGHLKGGSFSRPQMMSMLETAVSEALRDGFAGLCAAGDMTWLLDEAPGSEAIVEYEAMLNHFYANSRALGLCQYNRRTMPAAILDHCMATHRHIRIDGPILLDNPFYELPVHAVQRKPVTDREVVERKVRRATTHPSAGA
jgi:MEDS: MEthanogen/methylotroph, DcmR Sensory domain